MDSVEFLVSSVDGQPDEEKLELMSRNLLFLLRCIERLKSDLQYNNEIFPQKRSSEKLRLLIRECEPFMMCLEFTARRKSSNRSQIPETMKKRLLDMSELLMKHLEHLSLLYSSFGLISLNDSDPNGMSAVRCGEFFLGDNCSISTSRYFKLSLYSTNMPTLYKRLRWNVKIHENTPDRRVIDTKYFFLCCSEEPIIGVSDLLYAFHGSPGSSTSQDRMVWSIGQWVPLFPREDTDIETWVLCGRPMAYYKLHFIVGFQEPSHTAATDLLIQVLNGPGVSQVSSQTTAPVSNASTGTSHTPSPEN